jgi:hypothetical protein
VNAEERTAWSIGAAADLHDEIYQSYIHRGFTREEAVELLKARIIAGA